jgi:hypothetical protein
MAPENLQSLAHIKSRSTIVEEHQIRPLLEATPEIGPIPDANRGEGQAQLNQGSVKRCRPVSDDQYSGRIAHIGYSTRLFF